MDIRVETVAGGAYVIRDATAFGMDAVAGRTDSDPTIRVFGISDSDTVTRI